MSLAAWKTKYYPTEVDKCSVEDSLDHSIRKWSGLFPIVLKRFRLKADLNGRKIIDPARPEVWLTIDDSSCALCYHYHDYDTGAPLWCNRCPIAAVSARVSRERCIVEYETWHGTGDPRDMLRLLRAAKKAQTQLLCAENLVAEK